jgi:phosphatidylserine decarboxylase
LAAGGEPILLVAVAAILVACIRLTFLDTAKALREHGPGAMPVSVDVAKGEEMGWFEHGSTIVMFVPPGFALAAGIETGAVIKAGQALLVRA